MADSRDIYVYADWDGLDEPSLMGVLHSDYIRGKEVFSFAYDKAWLQSGEFRLLDPNLGQFGGSQYIRDEKPNFGAFLDSSPDRWGRLLMKRREAIMARSKDCKSRVLTETDYLLGVYDGSRMGALRFKLNPTGEFLDDNKELTTPPWANIRDLEYASLKLEADDSIDDPEYRKWLNMLIAPGSSLGGARPKANVVDTEGHLWIAKFPSGNDSKDMGAWEKVVNILAARCGIDVPETQAEHYSSKQHTFLSRRFDRTNDGRRIHFASAMTMLGQSDGADHTTGASYLDIVDFLIRHGANVDRDLEQLWRRIVFNIAVSNCDDHLRNHGFLLTENGWVLSPAYDINPDENGTGLKLNISEDDNSLDFGLALSVSPFFRVSEVAAEAILKEVEATTANWRKVASDCGISRSEQELVRLAFNAPKR